MYYFARTILAITVCLTHALKNMRFDFALASAYPKPFCTSVKISPIKLSAMTIASFVALQGADSLGTSAAYVVVAKMLTKVKIIIAFIVFINSSNPIV